MPESRKHLILEYLTRFDIGHYREREFESMPSGRTHDLVTLVLTVPAFAVTYMVTKDASISAVTAAFFVFGGLMFGPDLDTVSKQYSRWWIFKGLWFPYRTFFKHRSRWSHGLIFGTLIRVIYFTGVITLGGFLATFAVEIIWGTKLAGTVDLLQAWQRLGQTFNQHIGKGFAIATFAGLWLGAASHTFADMAGSYIKTGRTSGFL
jgi:uncharacterized metal-binding protein